MDAKFDVENWFSNFIEKLELSAEDKIKLLREYSSLKDNDGANLSKEELDSLLKKSIGGYRGMLYEPKDLGCMAQCSDRKINEE